MRVLWARMGQPYCPKCDVPIGTQTADEIVERVLAWPEGTRALLLAPIERSGQEEYAELFAREKANGFARVRVDGVVHDLSNPPTVDRRSRHKVELVVDRIVIRSSARSRIADSIELALSIGNGVMVLAPVEDQRAADLSPRGHSDLGNSSKNSDDAGDTFAENSRTPDSDEHAHTRRRKAGRPRGLKPAALSAADSALSEMRFSQRRSCTQCGTSYEELTPHHFSFNTRLGWCESCEGLGTQVGASVELVVSQPRESIRAGAIAGWENINDNPLLNRMVGCVADHLGFGLDTPWYQLTEEAKRGILYGTGAHWFELDANVKTSKRQNVKTDTQHSGTQHSALSLPVEGVLSRHRRSHQGELAIPASAQSPDERGGVSSLRGEPVAA